MIEGESERVAVAIGEQPILAALAAAPDGPHGMDHVTRGKAEAWRDLGLARLAAAEKRAGLAQLRACRAVDGAVDAAAAEKCFIGGVDDGVDIEPGNVALDGDGHNSPYAAALVKHMETPGKDVSAVLVAVRNDVLHATDGKQVPWEHTSLTGEVYFRPGSAPGATTTSTAPPPAFKTTAPFVPDYDKEMEIAFWNAVKESKSPAVLQTYLDRFPGGTFSGLARVMVDQLKQNQGAKASGGTRVANLPSDASKLPDAPSTNAPALARALQSELKRVGCDPGSTEGNWGAKSKEALRKFQRFSKLSVSADEPTEAALQLVAGQKGRICPLECDRGESEVNGKCVAKAKTDKGRAAESRQKRAPDREREAAPPPGGGIGIGVCVRTGGMAFCAR